MRNNFDSIRERQEVVENNWREVMTDGGDGGEDSFVRETNEPFVSVCVAFPNISPTTCFVV